MRPLTKKRNAQHLFESQTCKPHRRRQYIVRLPSPLFKFRSQWQYFHTLVFLESGIRFCEEGKCISFVDRPTTSQKSSPSRNFGLRVGSIKVRGDVRMTYSNMKITKIYSQKQLIFERNYANTVGLFAAF